MYIEQTELNIKEIKRKITNTKSRKTVLQKIKNSLKKNGVPTFNKTGEFVLNNDNSVSRFTNYLNKKKKREVVYKDIYTFEVEYLNKELKRHKQRVGALTFNNSYGIIGVDCNLDHYALSNVSDDGNLLNSKVIDFELFDKLSGQITKIIENKAKEVVDYAYNLSKPIGLEKLNTTLSKSGKKYNNKKNNLLLSMFASRKLTSAIKNRAEKLGIEVKEVNPAYTSISARFKYMKKYKTSVHQVAGLTIGRKALGYKENIPKYYKKLVPKINEKKNNYLKWNEINNFYKKINYIVK